MNITLQPEWARFVEDQLKAGRFETAEEVVNAALCRLRHEVEIDPEELERLKAEVAIGVAEADRGELEPWDPEAIWDEVQRLHAEQNRNGEKKAG